MKRIYLGIFFKILIFIALSINLAQGSFNKKPSEMSDISSEGYLFTELAGDLLTVDIRDVALEEVLKQISAQNGITFLLPPSLGEEKVMVRFSHYKIDRGLNKILAPYNRIFIYSEENYNPDQPSLTKLTEVRIYPRYEDKKKGRVEMASVKSPKTSKPRRESENKGAKGSGRKKSGEKEGRESVKHSPKSLKKKNSKMSVEKVKTLARVGNAEAIGQLALAMKDKDPQVREEAEKALEKIGETLREDSQSEEDPEESPPSEGGEANLTLTTGSGNGINLELSNDLPVRGVQFTLNGAKPSEVRTTSRTEGFFTKFNENNGTVVLVSLSGKKIDPGTGPIAEIVCDKADTAGLSNIKITNY